jgi:hypothetical protein
MIQRLNLQAGRFLQDQLNGFSHWLEQETSLVLKPPTTHKLWNSAHYQRTFAI